MREILTDSLFFGTFLSIASYELGLILKQRLRSALFNPLLISILVTIAVLLFVGIDYETYQKSTEYITCLLTPSTVCLAVPLYEQLGVLKKNFRAVMLGILAGVITSMTSVLLLSLIFGLTHEEYLTFLPKSITTAIGMGLSEEMGGIVTITVAAIVITGIFGNMTAELICRIFRIEEPVAQGIAIGTASHAMGTAKAMEMGETQGAMSGLAIAVAGLMTSCLIFAFASLN